jgi:hypothetical protein
VEDGIKDWKYFDMIGRNKEKCINISGKGCFTNKEDSFSLIAEKREEELNAFTSVWETHHL